MKFYFLSFFKDPSRCCFFLVGLIVGCGPARPVAVSNSSPDETLNPPEVVSASPGPAASPSPTSEPSAAPCWLRKPQKKGKVHFEIPSQGQSHTEEQAPSLSLQIRQGMGGGSSNFRRQVSLQKFNRRNEMIARDRRQIVYSHPFPQGGRDLNFVFSKNFLDSTILRGSVTYQVWQATNQWASDSITEPIQWDPNQDLFFISIFDLLSRRNSEQPRDPSAETQVFILELGLANHSNQVVEILFRISKE